MAAPVNDTYTAASGAGIYGGKYEFLPSSLSGGTVANLASTVSESGFTLLTTAPSSPTFRNNPHSGAAWDEDRQVMYITGAETHSVDSYYDNNIYMFNLSTGFVENMYAATPTRVGYKIDADGYLYDSGSLRPWASHTYDRLVYDAQNKKLGVVIDTGFHSYTNPVQEGSVAMADRKVPIWWLDVRTQKWSHEWSSDIQLFIAPTSLDGVAKEGNKYVTSDGMNLHILDAGVYSSVSVYGITNTAYHNTALLIDDVYYKFCGNTSTPVCSVHPLSDVASSQKYNIADFPVLTGWSAANKPACVMTDKNIMFLAQKDLEIGAFIFNTTNHTVTDTGHRLTVTQALGTYEFKMEWSNSLNAAVYANTSGGDPLKFYLIRV